MESGLASPRVNRVSATVVLTGHPAVNFANMGSN